MSSGWPVNLAVISPLLTPITSLFLHADFVHLFGNMIFLWIFGRRVEDRLGPAWFAIFYLVCGIAAALSQIIAEPHAAIPMIGASGAISGVLGAYLILFPRALIIGLRSYQLLLLSRSPGRLAAGIMVLAAIHLRIHRQCRSCNGRLVGPYRRVCGRLPNWICAQGGQGQIEDLLFELITRLTTRKLIFDVDKIVYKIDMIS